MQLTKEYLDTLKPGSTKKKVYFTNGEYEIYDTYKIPLSDLSFNIKNGRINTLIAQYNDEQNLNLNEIKQTNPTEFNQIMINFIKQSSDDNEVSFNKTKNDIAKNKQKEAGITLENGNVIDGNRRLACIMELFNDTHDEEFAYFETCVLPPMAEDKIQSIELIANNADAIRPYNPIDKLAYLYQTVYQDKTLSKEKYLQSAALSEKEFAKEEQLLNIILDFLQ